jgi:conserved hypothetical protein
MEKEQFLEYIKDTNKRKNGKIIALYLCKKCNKTTEKLKTLVKNNRTTSCGCNCIEKIKQAKTKHGMVHTKIYKKWKQMKQRCYSKTYQHYDRYGGRGIKVCDEWLNSFEKFYKDMGDLPGENYQLDRINNDDNYYKENCRWVTPSENCYNRKIYSNKTGFTGVSENTSKKGRYSAWFSVNRKHVQVGTFNTPQEAYKARIEAMKKYNKEHNTNLQYKEYEDFIKDIV